MSGYAPIIIIVVRIYSRASYHRGAAAADIYVWIVSTMGRSPPRLVGSLIIELPYRSSVPSGVFIGATGLMVIIGRVLARVTVVIVSDLGMVISAVLLVTLIDAPGVTFTH